MTQLARRFSRLVRWAALCLAWSLKAQTPIFINEIHYDNTGTDAGEAIEIAGPAGTILTGWSIVLYNGSGGAVYDTDALSGTIPNLGGGFGVVVLTYPVNGIQNGSPDGIALVDAANAVIQFLSYEGSFTAVGGPANGIVSTDIGVSENGSEPVGQSLRLSGTGTNYEDFIWNSPAAASFGDFNTGQTFGGVDQPPTVLSTMPANGATGNAVDANITVNFSEAVNVVGSWFSINGSLSGSHVATVSGGPQNFVLNPDVDFSDNETVTVTLFAANVTDMVAPAILRSMGSWSCFITAPPICPMPRSTSTASARMPMAISSLAIPAWQMSILCLRAIRFKMAKMLLLSMSGTPPASPPVQR